MPDTINEEAAKAENLVSATFRSANGRMVTRDVYPEVAKFINSRHQATREYHMLQAKIQVDRQAYITEKMVEFYADEQQSDSWDSYTAGRDWDRTVGRRPEYSLDAAERRFYDFLEPNRIAEDHRHGARQPDGSYAYNPNSWAILKEEAQAAGHRTVVWIIDHCLSEPTYALEIIQHLPATVDELWRVAKDDNSMCGVFDQFFAEAERDGLFGESDLPNSVREQTALRSFIRREFGSRSAQNLLRHVKPVVKAEVEYAVTEARKEWDKEILDKYAAAEDLRALLRSLAENHPVIQTHLNRSDGAIRAAETRAANRSAIQQVIDAQPDRSGELQEVEISF